jgi:aryl-alcohol dehydrogenase-like predicted oxidoreductase
MVTPVTVFPKEDHRSHRNRENMLDNFEKAESLTFLWEDTGRTMGQAAIAGILANPAFTTVLPTVVTTEEIHEYAAASELPLNAEEKAMLDGLWSRNFDHTDRYEMPLKSSV